MPRPSSRGTGLAADGPAAGADDVPTARGDGVAHRPVTPDPEPPADAVVPEGVAPLPPVRIVDTPTERVRHPADLVGLILSLVGIGAVLVLAVYAQGTTTGLTEDVQGFGSVLRRLLFLPVNVLEALITIIAPIAVLTELVLRRQVRHAFEAVGAALVGITLAILTTWVVVTIGTDALVDSLSVRARGEVVVAIPALLAGTAALLTGAGSRGRRRTIGWSWNLLWLALGVALITGLVTLPGALLTVLLGRVVGLAVRYLSGVQSQRAYGAALVDGIRRAGFEPVQIVRVRDVASEHPEDGADLDPAVVALTRQGDHRVYATTTAQGDRLDVVVFDGDRQVVGMLTRFWRSLRLRGIDGRAVVSLRQATERAALLSYAAWSAGVCTPRLLGLAEAEDSMLLIQQHAHGAVPLRDLASEELTDDVLDAIWEQVRIAHSAGLAHRSLTSDVVLVQAAESPDALACDPAEMHPPVGRDVTARPAAWRRHEPPGATSEGPVALLTGWAQGDVASSELARRLDVSHLLAVLALRVGADRAVESAARVLHDADLATIGPLLQAIALPRTTREEARRNKGVLAEVREALLARLPDTDVEPQRLVRFGARTVITILLAIGAAVAIVTTFNLPRILDAFASAEPWWAVVAFACGLVTFFGSALSLVAFAPVKVPLWRATLVQAAGAYIALGAPAGVGPAALNLRMLTRRGVPNALAVASVGLVQVSQFITTVLLLLVLSLVSGSAALEPPSATVLTALAIVLAALGVAMLVPRVRQWVLARVVPLWHQTWPRLVQVLGQPRRFAVALTGNLIMTLGYLGAFYATLAAFGQEMSLIDLAVVYLLGNAAGAAVPTPGGLGSVEFALTTALTAAGIGAAIATSAVLVFRALTFWLRVPVGWFAMRALQRTGEL